MAVMVDGRRAGCASIDEDGQLLHFFVGSDFDHLASECFQAVLDDRGPTSIVASTVDPGMMSVTLNHWGTARQNEIQSTSGSVTPVALMYHHKNPPAGASLPGLEHAYESSHHTVVDFMEEETGAPRPWLEGYVAERIDRRELYLHHVDGQIAGAGERRLDRRARGHAHLGIVVATAHRRQGLGSQLMNTLVEFCVRDTLTPLCSTEPDNHGAQKLIRQAGFRSSHRIFSFTIDSTAPV